MPKIKHPDPIANHRLYFVLKTMICRCYKTDHISYKKYGAKGITVCEEWLNDARSFITWGQQNGWKPGLQIDRIDGTKSYSPDNCRFVTPLENNNNRSNTVKIVRDGASKTLKEWGKIHGLRYEILQWRLRKFGANSPELFAPLKRIHKKFLPSNH